MDPAEDKECIDEYFHLYDKDNKKTNICDKKDMIVLKYRFNNDRFTKCHDSCLQCFGDSTSKSTECSVCEKDLYIIEEDGNCVSFCGSGYYAVKSPILKCLPCSKNCSICESEKCSVCFSGYYVDSSGSCVLCKNNCKTCSSESTCTSCLLGFSELETKCVSTCPIGYYYVSINSETSICKKCSPQCSKCINNEDNCITCANLILPDENSITFKCLDKCPTDYYPNKITKICENCIKMSLNIYDDECVKTCPVGLFSDFKEKLCKKCSELNKVLFEGDCIENCPLNFEPVDGKCELIEPPPSEINCSHDICMNNSTCTMNKNNVECKCHKGFWGDFCENVLQLGKIIIFI